MPTSRWGTHADPFGNKNFVPNGPWYYGLNLHIAREYAQKVAVASSEPALRIVGREHELEVLTAAVDAAASAGSAVTVCGEAGIGKSVLIEAAARRGHQSARPPQPQ